MSTKTKTEYLIQRDYGTERNHKWVNCITMYDYECARSYIEYSALRDKCIGKACANFGERGCKGGEYPPWSWSKWYLEELPKIKREAKQ